MKGKEMPLDFPYRVAPLILAIIGWFPAPSFAQDAPFRRGDSNLDGAIDISDALKTLQILFLGQVSAGCDDAADFTDDGRLNLLDPISSILFIFHSGLGPQPPNTECGVDPTEDSMGCSGFPPCETPPIPCADQATINEILGQSLQTTFCIPAGILQIPSDRLNISICPETGAQPCGLLQTPGCPGELTSIGAAIKADAGSLVIHVEGRMTGLPVEITETVFNTTTTCATDFHGAQPEEPFSFDIVLPLILEEEKPGEYLITGVEGPSIENVVMKLTASGGFVCALFQAAGDVVVTPLMAILEQGLLAVFQGFETGLVGLKVCTET